MSPCLFNLYVEYITGNASLDEALAGIKIAGEISITSDIGEGNGNPFQCSCLENPRDRGAQWAAVYGVAQSRTLLKRPSSSSSRYADDTTLMAESEEELKSLDESERGE